MTTFADQNQRYAYSWQSKQFENFRIQMNKGNKQYVLQLFLKITLSALIQIQYKLAASIAQ